MRVVSWKFGAVTCLISLLVGGILCVSSRVLAQITEGSIVGLVTDPSNAAVPGTLIMATNVSTGVVTKTKATLGGWYNFPLLIAGTYTVTAEQKGFARAVTAPVVLHAGDKLRVDVKLTLGETSQRVEVTAAAPLLNATTSALGTVIESREISQLPLNGRDFTQLLTLQPGWNEGTYTAQRGGVTLSGLPGLGNSFLLDGVDMSFGENNGVGAAGIGFGGYLITTVSIDAIQELKATTGAASAEYDRADGGTINVVTKSGTNKFHGAAWDYLQNSAVGANSFFSNMAHLTKPSLEQNQFGANLGGPILRDRLFFFVNYEGVRSKRGETLSGAVPTEALYSQLTNPQMLKFMKKWYPQTNLVPTSDPLTALYTRNAEEAIAEDTGLAHIDANLGKQRLSFRVVADDQNSTIPNFLAGLESGYPYPTRNYEVSWTGMLTPTSVNEFHVGLNSNPLRRHTYAIDTSLDQNLPGVGLYTIDPEFPGISMRPGPYADLQIQDNLAADAPTKTIGDDFTWVHGAHTLKTGLNFRHTNADRVQYGEGVWYNFNTVQQLINDQVYNFELDFGNPGGTPIKFWTYGAYVQDSWAVNRRLTVNYGLHYNYFQPLKGPIGFATSNPFGPTTPLNTPLWHSQDTDFSPRVGIAYTLTSDGKTVFRAGGGTYYGAAQPFFNFDSNWLSADVPAFPDVLPSAFPPTLNYTFPNLNWNFLQAVRSNPSLAPPVAGGIQAPDPNHHDEYSEQYNATVEHQFTPSLMASVSYVGNRTLHEYSSVLENPVNPATGMMPYANVGPIWLATYSGRLWFNGLELSLRKVTSHGLSFDAFYTYSKSMNYDSADTNESKDESTQNFSDIAASIGPTQGEVTQRFQGDYVYAIPTGGLTKNSALARGILGGWSLQGIIGASTGPALNVITGVDQVGIGYCCNERPDAVPGVSPYEHGTNRLQFLNPAAFNTATVVADKSYGNVGYDSVIGPGAFTWDASLHKTWKIHETQELTFRFEMFNFLNHVVLGSPDTTTTDSTFGLITSGSAPRELQFALRYSF